MPEAGSHRTAADRLARAGLGPLLDELVRRYESGAEPVRITVPPLGPVGERALADLLGLDAHLGTGGSAGRTRSLPIERLSAALGDDAPPLREVVVQLRGPLRNRRAERRADNDRRAELWAWLAERAGQLDLFPDRAATERWVERTRRAGIPGGDVERHRSRLTAAVAVLDRLPAAGISRASLAADVTGDAHALDPGHRVGRLVLDALAAADDVDPPHEGAAVRDAWERVGVVVDPLSSTALVLGLRSEGDGALARTLALAADADEPAVVTLSQLRRWPLRASPTRTIFVVENPAVVAEAAGAGLGAPIVCTNGWPSVAVLHVLAAVSSAGTQLLQHADFDPAGIKITAWLQVQYATTPWRMSAADYGRAVAGTPGPPITGLVPDTPWDPALATAMRQAGQAVHEETLRADLLDALARDA